MFDIYITILVAVIYVVIFANCTYFLIQFSHEDDNDDAYLSKVIVVLGLTTAVSSIFLFPLDIMNRESSRNGIPLELITFCILSVIILWVFILIPFTYVHYSTWDPDKPRKAIKYAATVSFILTVIFGVLAALSYIFLSDIEIDYTLQTSNLVSADRPPDSQVCLECQWDSMSTQMTVKPSFLIHLVAILCFFGTILFSLFCGIGLVTAPQDFFNVWYKRPKRIDGKEFEERKVTIGKAANELISKAVEFNKKAPKTKVYNQWRKEVYLLEETWDKTVEAHKPNGIRVLWYWLNLFISIIGAILSITIFLHLILSRLLNVTMFLNVLFVSISGFQNILGFIVFMLYALWLEVCVINGNLNFGLHVPFFFSIHPMKSSGTLMNSFLYNTGLLCISSVAVTKFCVINFYVYARGTRTHIIFNVAIESLAIFKYVWMVCDWALLGFAVLIALILFIKSLRK